MIWLSLSYVIYASSGTIANHHLDTFYAQYCATAMRRRAWKNHSRKHASTKEKALTLNQGVRSQPSGEPPCGRLAQMGENLLYKQNVGGSNLLAPTFFCPFVGDEEKFQFVHKILRKSMLKPNGFKC